MVFAIRAILQMACATNTLAMVVPTAATLPMRCCKWCLLFVLFFKWHVLQILLQWWYLLQQHSPCVAANGVCYSCYSSNGMCYKYSCNGGTYCSNTPHALLQMVFAIRAILQMACATNTLAMVVP